MSSLKYRPAAVTGFTALILMFLAFVTGFVFSGGLVYFAVGAVLAVILIATRNIRNLTFFAYVCSALIFSGMMLMTVSYFDIDASLSYAGEECIVCASVTDDTASYSNSEAHTLKIKNINGKKLNTKLVVYSKSSFDFVPGDVVAFRAKLSDNISDESFTGRMNGMSDETYLYTYLTDSDEITLIKDGTKTVEHHLYLIRKEIKSRIYSFLPGKEGAVTVAMLLGDKSGVDSEINDSFRKTGISHLFAVSGLHLSVWMMSIYLILRKLFKIPKLPEILCIAFTLLFMALTGFTASVCRAGIMLIAVLLATLFDEDNDPLSFLGLSALIILLIRPTAAVSVSLLLSFCATWGIITAYPPVDRKINELLYPVKSRGTRRFTKGILSTSCVSLCATLFTLPVTAAFIGSVSAVSPITNIFVSFAATIQMIFGGLSAVLYPIKFIARPLALLCGLIAKYVIFVSDFISKIPFCSFETDSVYFRISLLFIVTGIICVAVLIENPKKRFISIGCIILSVSIVTASAYFVFERDKTHITAFNTGKGISVLVEHNGCKMLLGCGGSDDYPENGMISAVGDKLDFLLVPDRSEESSSMFMYFADLCRDGNVVCGERNQSVGLIKNDYIVNGNFTVNPWNGAELRFYKKNKSSYALLDTGKSKILIIFRCENTDFIPEEFLDSDVLITSCNVPNDFDFGGFGKIIVSSSAKNTDKTVSHINNSNIYALCSYKGIEYIISKNGKEIINSVQR